MAKRLSEIPYDLVSYIQIETSAIQDANDKQIISSYCLSKLRNVEWYIRLLETGSEQYVVPHSQYELESIRDQLRSCHEQIMATSVSSGKRPIFDIKYPSGYEG